MTFWTIRCDGNVIQFAQQDLMTFFVKPYNWNKKVMKCSREYRISTCFLVTDKSQIDNSYKTFELVKPHWMK
jgi:hypothetical protein